MMLALDEARKAYEMDEVPIGCVIVKGDVVIARAHNLRESMQQASAHAEMQAIEKACTKLGSWRLEGCSIYVTLEPCPMCSGAIIQARCKELVYGAKDPKGGCIESCMQMYEVKGFNHYPKIVAGVCGKDCADLLKSFFQMKRSVIHATSKYFDK